jgi:hypothetical protein
MHDEIDLVARAISRIFAINIGLGPFSKSVLIRLLHHPIIKKIAKD